MFIKEETAEETIKRLEKEGKIIPGIFDPVFKNVLKDNKLRGILAYLISEVTKLDYNYVRENVDFLDKELSKYKYLEKGKIVDLLVYIKGNVINLEANQRIDAETLEKNNSYHYQIGGEYTRNSKLARPFIIQINFDRENGYTKLITKFQMKDESGEYTLDESFINYHINIDYVLKKMYNKEELTRFEKILYMLVIEDKKELRKVVGNDKELRYMADKIEEMSHDEMIIGLYDKEQVENRMKLVGLLNAEEEGKKKGIEQNKIEIAKKMLEEKIELSVIGKVTDLSIEEIENLK